MVVGCWFSSESLSLSLLSLSTCVLPPPLYATAATDNRYASAHKQGSVARQVVVRGYNYKRSVSE